MTTLEAISLAASDINELEYLSGRLTIDDGRYFITVNYDSEPFCRYEKKTLRGTSKVGGISEEFDETLFLEVFRKCVDHRRKMLEVNDEDVNYYDPWRSGATTDKNL